MSIVLGVAFLLSGMANMLVLNTSLNILAFRLPNIVFSVLVGLLLLVLGSYGRISGGLPADNPYRGTGRAASTPEHVDRDPEVTSALAAAERAFALRHATEDQLRRLLLVHAYRSAEDRLPAPGTPPSTRCSLRAVPSPSRHAWSGPCRGRCPPGPRSSSSRCPPHPRPPRARSPACSWRRCRCPAGRARGPAAAGRWPVSAGQWLAMSSVRRRVARLSVRTGCPAGSTPRRTRSSRCSSSSTATR